MVTCVYLAITLEHIHVRTVAMDITAWAVTMDTRDMPSLTVWPPMQSFLVK